MHPHLVRHSALFSIVLALASLGACRSKTRGEAGGGRGGDQGGHGGSVGAAGVTGGGGPSVGGGGGDAGIGGAIGGSIGNGGSGESGAGGGGSSGASGGSGAAGGQVAGAGGGLDAGGAAGVMGTGGATSNAQGPCDIYRDAGQPCVAAYSTVRRLLSTYGGPLYQIRSGSSDQNTGSGGETHDIGQTTDGFADAAAVDAACAGTICTVSLLYDQSGKGNHLPVAKKGLPA